MDYFIYYMIYSAYHISSQSSQTSLYLGLSAFSYNADLFLEHMNKIALTFDTELWYEGDWMQPYINDEMRFHDKFPESIEAIMNILKHKGFHATFFVTRKVIDTHPDIIRTLSGAGHEIGLHGTTHTRLQDISNKTQYEKDIIETVYKVEQLTGKKVKGFRAPHFSLTQNTSWLLPILERHGFVYDSSVFPIKNSEYGVKNAPLTPYKINSNAISEPTEHGSLIEIPPAIFSIGLFKLPISGGIYFRILPLKLFAFLLKKTAEKNAFTPNIYLHPHELWADTPKIEGPLIRTTLKYWNTHKSLKKFASLSERFIFDSIENTYFP